MNVPVFIQTNEKQRLGAIVAKHSFERETRHLGIEINIMHYNDFEIFREIEGRIYLRNGRKMKWDPDDLQSFTLLRFVPPASTNYQGKALVVDPDVFCVSAPDELLNADMKHKSILCRRVARTDGRGDYWASSVMLLNCSKLTHWNLTEIVEDLVRQKIDYSDIMNLRAESQQTIGTLDARWNDFDNLTGETKLLHNTSRITQPWKTGLPIDFTVYPLETSNDQSLKSALALAFKRVRRTLSHIIRPPSRYLPHPDAKQEQLFFRLLAECVADGVISEKDVREGVQKRYLRADTMALLNAARA